MLLVVAYDVADDRRRTRLRRVLLGYGVPIQESVFECEASVEQARDLKRRVRQVINSRVDRVNYYPLCDRCVGKAEDGARRRRPPEPRVIVV